MSLRAVVVGWVVVAYATGSARADVQPADDGGVVTEDEVVVDDGVPFVAGDLATALWARVEHGARPARVVVHAIAGDFVEIEVEGRTRELALEGRHGTSAARLVALAALDLMVPEVAALPAMTAVAHATPAAPIDVAGPPPMSIAVMGAASQWSGVMAGIGVELVVPRDGWGVAVELGGGTLVTGDLHLDTALARVGIAVRPSILELRIGATLAPVIATDGAGDMTVLVGAGASGRVRIPAGPARHVVLGVGLDVFATRTEYVRAGMTTVATPWFAPWFAVGMETSL